eukprot:CAMPEP_0181202700 /NCGR_PEP_ID=MMETSP1096-20121128/18990_1 /TAXON_ID=156174 ORGANISM="Chrysochromulina ericina, Strain CCMP281" /NCGR_SAMPLE_ID=MMETSP1096 /ASSEMBLY_ACC=CAM_ASM_000453 /LENGTH=57 /DNA_ID=CAMNT_0023293247 /DNA_START=350 /DNA_END=523 /DNA_ORIENTATION=+
MNSVGMWHVDASGSKGATAFHVLYSPAGPADPVAVWRIRNMRIKQTAPRCHTAVECN